jgi:hypothetical protein
VRYDPHDLAAADRTTRAIFGALVRRGASQLTPAVITVSKTAFTHLLSHQLSIQEAGIVRVSPKNGQPRPRRPFAGCPGTPGKWLRLLIRSRRAGRQPVFLCRHSDVSAVTIDRQDRSGGERLVLVVMGTLRGWRGALVGTGVLAGGLTCSVSPAVSSRACEPRGPGWEGDKAAGEGDESVGSHCGAFELDVGATKQEADRGAARAPGNPVALAPGFTSRICGRSGGLR